MSDELELIEAPCIYCNHVVGLKVRVGEAVSLRCLDCRRIVFTREANTPAPQPITVPAETMREKVRRPTVETKAEVNVKSRGAPDNWVSNKVVPWKPGEADKARRLLDW